MSEHGSNSGGQQAYQVVDYRDHEFEQGDTFQQLYDITFPSWMPETGRNEVLDELLGYGTKIETEVTSEFDDGNEVSVRSTDLEQIDSDTHRYSVTYHVESAEAEQAITPAGIWLIVYGVLIILGLVGIAWVLRETRLLLETEGGGLALAALLGVGAYAAYSYREGPKNSTESDPPSTGG